MMVYICIKFHENIFNSIRVMECTRKVNGRTDGRTKPRHNTTCLRRVYNKKSRAKLFSNSAMKISLTVSELWSVHEKLMDGQTDGRSHDIIRHVFDGCIIKSLGLKCSATVQAVFAILYVSIAYKSQNTINVCYIN